MSTHKKLVVPVWLRALIVVAIVAIWLITPREDVRQSTESIGDRNPAPSTVNDSNERAARSAESNGKKATDAVVIGEAQASLIVENVTLKDQSGRVIFRGDVDLQPTLDRIADGKLLERFRNDGSVFQNREKRLPKRPSGYYREYVVPTDGERGPGPQRLVVGNEGEAYYTHDHYKSFRKIR